MTTWSLKRLVTPMPEYSLIIPVYNRPGELEELLESLRKQSFKDFEVIIVEDGSHRKADHLIPAFKGELDLYYLEKENSGPGLSRNFGTEQANGNTFIFLDSDCILPAEYLRHVDEFLAQQPVDFFGGPDKADPSFSVMQKGVNYAMTSYLTTGGIRGRSRQMERYKPRSFNMGVKKTVFEAVGGFDKMRFGEDIDLSIRLELAGYQSALIPKASVYHKRRTNLAAFFRQVFHSGNARIKLSIRHPQTLKPVHLLPSIFTIGCILLFIGSFIYDVRLLLPITLFSAMVFVSSSWINRNLLVGAVSIFTSFTQLFGYGLGFIYGTIHSRFFKVERP